MAGYLKSYDMELIARGPLHVGSGERIKKKEYIYLPQKGTVLVPDITRMIEGLRKKRLDDMFLKYMMDSADQRPLGQWLFGSRIMPDEYNRWIRYRLDGGDRLKSGKKPTEIVCFQKDAFGLPLIPGSSIKGMLRTILLAGELLKNDGRFESLKRTLPQACAKANRNNFLLPEQKQIEEDVFHTLERTDAKGKPVPKRNAVNDCLSGLIISDSQPLKLTDLTLCQKLDRGLNGDYNSQLNLLRESLKPGTVVRFTLTIDSGLCPYTIQDIMKAVAAFGDAYYTMFSSHFAGTDRPAPDTVWLGGGSGFFSKTVLYPALSEKDRVRSTVEVFRRTIHPKVWNQHNHDKDVPRGVSPHTLKCTEYEGRIYHFGECTMRVKKEVSLYTCEQI